jgi:cell division septation protein DedD
MGEMEEHTDDQSHYEISLTAAQAFVAFVLLLLSLAASFAFGLMIGKGQADERLIVRKETPVVSEASVVPHKAEDGKIVELGVPDDEFRPAPTDSTKATTEPAPATATTIEEAAPVEMTASAAEMTATQTPVAPTAAAVTAPPPAPTSSSPYYAQLLSTSDQKTAETLAARVINAGFMGAYVERGTSDKGVVFRVRVKFPTELDARASEQKLHAFSKDVWITSK